MKKMKKAVALLLAAGMLTGLAGCGTPKDKADGDIPTLNWYLFFKEQDDMEAVQAEVNRITEKEIGAHVNIVRIEEGDYNQKIQLGLAGGESIDICNMAPRFGYLSHVSRGAFLSLDELIEEYAPEMYDIMPEEFWDATKVNGKIYGVPNYQIVGRMNGFVAQDELLKKYNFDLSSVKTLEDIEPFLKSVKEGEESNMLPSGISGGSYSWGLSHYVGFEAIGSEKYPTAIRNHDETLTVVNQFATEEFKNYCKLMRDWYQKGYVAQAGSSDNESDLLQQGLIASRVDNVAPGMLENFEKQMGGKKVQTQVIDPPFVNTANIIATMNCINSRTKYPELCIKFLDLMNRNVDNIYNTVVFGIEGKHYNKIGENRIEKIADSGYDNSGYSWEFGNNFNAYVYGTQDDDLWKQTAEINNNAEISMILGFTFDIEPVQTELSSCQAVVDEYLGSIARGSLDVDTELPKFLEKLESAGVDKVIAEAQRQVDEWKAAK